MRGAHRLLDMSSLQSEAKMDTTMNWLARAFYDIVAFFPKLFAGLVILLIGYVIGLVLAKVTRALAHRLGFDRLVMRLGLSERRGGRSPSYVLGSAVLFVVVVATLMQASRVWDLTFVADGLARVIAYVPHVIAAAVVFAVALLLGNWFRDRMTRRASTFSLLPSAVRAGVLAIGSFMALRELQIAPEIVNAAFISAVAAMAIATALAFGLGGREVAGRIARSWYDRRQEERLGNPPRVMDVPTGEPSGA
jgi:hypothetical protein